VLPPVGFFGTLTDILNSRDRNSVPLVLLTRNSKACNDLTVQWKYFAPHKWKRVLSTSHCVLTDYTKTDVLIGSARRGRVLQESKGAEKWPTMEILY